MPIFVAALGAVPVIGFLSVSSPGEVGGQAIANFRRGLAETGYVEGQNVANEYRWAENQFDRLPALAADLVGEVRGGADQHRGAAFRDDVVDLGEPGEFIG